MPGRGDRAEAIGIPVTGIDLLVPDVTGADYAFIEANERPGLANHEPQPTAAAFIDFSSPATRAAAGLTPEESCLIRLTPVQPERRRP